MATLDITRETACALERAVRASELGLPIRTALFTEQTTRELLDRGFVAWGERAELLVLTDLGHRAAR